MNIFINVKFNKPRVRQRNEAQLTGQTENTLPCRSRSPIEISDDERSNRPSKRARTPSCSESRRRNHRSRSRSIIEANDEGTITIVTVCRLLSALETDLIIVAQRVIELLEKAVTHERAKPTSSDELLRDLYNVNFLDTVREKLKGLLKAKLVGRSRIPTVKKAIRNITTLLAQSDDKAKSLLDPDIVKRQILKKSITKHINIGKVKDMEMNVAVNPIRVVGTVNSNPVVAISEMRSSLLLRTKAHPNVATVNSTPVVAMRSSFSIRRKSHPNNIQLTGKGKNKSSSS
jgi:hypothetical protein